MDNWKENPALFHGFNIRTDKGQVLPIMGATPDKKCVLVQTNNGVHSYETKYCKLLARPISDMTDEEIAWFWENDALRWDVDDYENVRAYLESDFQDKYPETLWASEMLHFLNCDVLPPNFSWKGVIDATTLEEV